MVDSTVRHMVAQTAAQWVERTAACSAHSIAVYSAAATVDMMARNSAGTAARWVGPKADCSVMAAPWVVWSVDCLVAQTEASLVVKKDVVKVGMMVLLMVHMWEF